MRPLLLLAVVFALVLSACKGTLPPQQSYDEIKKMVEQQGAQVSPPVEVTYKDLFKGADSKSLKEKEAAIFDGLLLNPQGWAMYQAFKTERDQRRAELEAERKRSAIERVLNEQLVARLKYQLDTSASWWSRNKGLFGLCAGTILGVALTVGLVYALTKGNGANTGTTGAAVKQFPLRPLVSW